MILTGFVRIAVVDKHHFIGRSTQGAELYFSSALQYRRIVVAWALFRNIVLVTHDNIVSKVVLNQVHLYVGVVKMATYMFMHHM